MNTTNTPIDALAVMLAEACERTPWRVREVAGDARRAVVVLSSPVPGHMGREARVECSIDPISGRRVTFVATYDHLGLSAAHVASAPLVVASARIEVADMVRVLHARISKRTIDATASLLGDAHQHAEREDQ